jgi:hypothetical protein
MKLKLNIKKFRLVFFVFQSMLLERIKIKAKYTKYNTLLYNIYIYKYI